MIDKLNPNNASHLMIWLVIALVGGSAGTGNLGLVSGATAEEVAQLEHRVQVAEKNDEAILKALNSMQQAQHQSKTDYYDAEIMQLELKASKTQADQAIIDNLKRKREAHVKGGSQ